MYLYPHTQYWLYHFANHPKYANKVFKIPDMGYPMFSLDKNFLVRVSKEEFVQPEENRLPLFIGSQFGLWPIKSKVPGLFDYHNEICVLAKSLLSGMVSGVNIYKVDSVDRRPIFGDVGRIERFDISIPDIYDLKTTRQGSFNYMNDEALPINHPALVMRIDSISAKCKSVDEFVKEYKLNATRNEHLLVITQKQQPPFNLFSLASYHFNPKGLINIRDYVFINPDQESHLELITGQQTNPQFKGLNWLGSKHDGDKHYVWFKPPQISDRG